MDAEVLVDQGLVLCDGPRWHDGMLWFSDLYGGAVYTLGLDGNLSKVLEVEGGPSGIGFFDDGSWVVASQRDQKLLRISTDGDVTVYADLSGVAVSDLNDLVVDSQQRIYVGCFGFDIGAGAPFHPAPLMRVDPDGSVTVVADGLSFPNGLLLNDAGDTLYVAQSHAHNILAFDVDEKGDLSHQRIWADLGDFRPDGICLDAEGAVWAGGIEACAFIRVAEGGGVLERIDMGDQWAIAPMLGGPDRRHLFLLTSTPVDPHDLKGAFVGRIEVRQVAAPGSGRP